MSSCLLSSWCLDGLAVQHWRTPGASHRGGPLSKYDPRTPHVITMSRTRPKNQNHHLSCLENIANNGDQVLVPQAPVLTSWRSSSTKDDSCSSQNNTTDPPKHLNHVPQAFARQGFGGLRLERRQGPVVAGPLAVGVAEGIPNLPPFVLPATVRSVRPRSIP